MNRKNIPTFLCLFSKGQTNQLSSLIDVGEGKLPYFELLCGSGKFDKCHLGFLRTVVWGMGSYIPNTLYTIGY